MQHKRLRYLLMILIPMGLGLLLTGWIVLPNIRDRFEQTFLRSLEREDLQLRYRDISLSWFGLKVHDIALDAKGFQAQGSILVQLKLWPGRNFARPERIVFEDWHINWHRRPSDSEGEAVDIPGKASHSSAKLAKRLEKILQTIKEETWVLDFKNLSLQIFDGRGLELLGLSHAGLSYASGDQALQVDIPSLRYRQREVLHGISGQFLLQKDRARFPFLLTAQDTGNIPWQVQGSLSKDFDSFDLRHKRSGLPMRWRRFLPWISPADSLQVLVKVRVEGLIMRENIDFDVQIASNNLQLTHELLGESAWGPFPFSLRTKGRFQADNGSIILQTGIAHLVTSPKSPPLKVFFHGEKADLLAPFSTQALRLSLSLPETPCQSLLDAWPREAFPLLHGFALQGNISGQAKFQFLIADEPAIQLGTHSFGCQLREVPERFSQQWLKNRNPASVSSDELKDQPALAAFLNPNFTPISQISESFLQGLISAEDGGFWQHSGFRWSALTAALQANLKAGKVIYGGSTLTMQMVKNLYLSRERVLSRKIQELFLAWAVEHVLSKEDILEIYANIVEFGPKLHGIQRASHGYFNKSPRDLNFAEGVFLASIMPSPFRLYYENYCQNRISDSLLERMQKTALGVSVLSKSSTWMMAYQRDLSEFKFAPGQACGRAFNVGGLPAQTPRL